MEKMAPMFQMKVKYFEGDRAVFAQRIRLTGGAYEVTGYLQYGACNDENCLPPTNVEFSYRGEGLAATAVTVSKAAPATPAPAVTSTSTPVATAGADHLAYWEPVIDELRSFGETGGGESHSWLYVFFAGSLGGLVALFTPCVWPIIPMTVSFFLKRSKDRRKGVRDAVTYGASIVVIYVTLGLAITLLFGASALNDLSTSAVFNILFFLLLVVFAASFFGAFELTLPSCWSNAVDSKADRTTGLLSIFLMAFTLSLVSFSCTGPIIGFSLGGGFHHGQYCGARTRYVGVRSGSGSALHVVRIVPLVAQIHAQVWRMDECDKGHARLSRTGLRAEVFVGGRPGLRLGHSGA